MTSAHNVAGWDDGPCTPPSGPPDPWWEGLKLAAYVFLAIAFVHLCWLGGRALWGCW